MYFFLPCREPWPGASVNSRLPKVEVTTADGEVKEISPAAWLDRHRSVEQMTWAPGEPMLIADKLFLATGGWVERRGVASLNHYRPPLIEPGNAAEADPWLDHVQKIYPADATHIVRWLAHRVQRPAAEDQPCPAAWRAAGHRQGQSVTAREVCRRPVERRGGEPGRPARALQRVPQERHPARQ